MPPRRLHLPAHERHLQVAAPVLASLEVLLSTENRAPIAWDFAIVKYSLAVPSEAVAAALLVTVDPKAKGDVELALYRPEDNHREVLLSGRVSSFADVPTEEAAKFILEIRHNSWTTNYTIAVVRSTITSSFTFIFPDPALAVPPQATLTGLSVFDSFGSRVRTDPLHFVPQQSQYIAVVDMEMPMVWVVASKNDPDAELDLRADGQDWISLLPGANSPLLDVPVRGWLLLEVRVLSPSTAAAGFKPLIYQLVVTREIICHERCRTCFGPGPDQCLTCPAPFVLFNGRCEVTGCPPNAYYEWQSYSCRLCDASCAQCDGPGKRSCTLCPGLHFLAPQLWEDKTAPCVIVCPVGTFAHPPSRRCREPPLAPVKAFYMQFDFRVPFQEFQYDRRLQESILNATAFVLGITISDVRAYQMKEYNQNLQITIEVVSPFLSRAQADKILIDSWFGAFEVPVDVVRSFPWDDLHPPVPPLIPEPVLPTWVLGIIASLVTSILVVIPMYCFYFRRLSNTRKRYNARVGVDPWFVDRVVHQSPAYLIRKFVAQESGGKKP